MMEREEQANIELLRRRREESRERLAELVLFGTVVQVEVRHDDIDDYNNEVPD